MNELPVISLFTGAGGLDLAAERVVEPPRWGPDRELSTGPGPLQVAVALDYEPEAIESLTLNHPRIATITGDIRTTTTKTILRKAGLTKGEAALVIGGPPCTPFSKSGYWLDYKREDRDPDASLLDEYARVVAEAKPEAFVLENVQGLTYRTHRRQLARALKLFADAGYHPSWKVLNAADYGVPQLRKRVFIIGRRDGKAFVFPEPTHSGWTEHSKVVDLTKRPYVTAGQVLKDLLPGEAEPGEIVEGQFAALAASIPPGHNYIWHSERGGGKPVFGFRTRYWTFLLRLDPERPSTTLQASPGPWVGPYHWENVINAEGKPRARRLRVPEMLRLQTFPDDYRFVGDRRSIQRQLGNAVPVELGKVVLRALLEQLGYLESSVEIPEQLALA